MLFDHKCLSLPCVTTKSIDMKRFLLFVLLVTVATAVFGIKVTLNSSKAEAEIVLHSGVHVCGLTAIPKKKASKIKLRTERGDTVIKADDIAYMTVRSSKFKSEKKYLMLRTPYHANPGGKTGKPVWMILWSEGPYCSMWVVSRGAQFEGDGKMVLWIRDDKSAVELYWKKSEEYRTMIWNRKQAARYLADDEVLVDSLRTRKTYKMADQVRDYVPERKL